MEGRPISLPVLTLVPLPTRAVSEHLQGARKTETLPSSSPCPLPPPLLLQNFLPPAPHTLREFRENSLKPRVQPCEDSTVLFSILSPLPNKSSRTCSPQDTKLPPGLGTRENKELAVKGAILLPFLFSGSVLYKHPGQVMTCECECLAGQRLSL